MPCLFHVSSAANRESILAHGLDWTRMGVARGLAGSTAAEEEGVFLCQDQFEARFFVDMNNTGDPVDVWAVTGVRGTGRQASKRPAAILQNARHLPPPGRNRSVLLRIGAGSPMRAGIREIVLQAYTAKTPEASRPSYPGSPPRRIAGDLHRALGAGHGYPVSLPCTDRPVRSEESSSLCRTDRCACFPAIHPR